MRQRRNLRLNYGSLFIAHMVMARGASMADVVAGLRSGKTVWQLAAERQIELKQITSDAKKLNGKIEDNIYRHYLTTSTDKTRDELEKYSPAADWTSADTNVSDDEIAQARDIFVLWRNQAAPREDARLGIAEENAAYQDACPGRHAYPWRIRCPSAGGRRASNQLGFGRCCSGRSDSHAHVHRLRGVGQRSYRNEVHSGFRVGTDIF